MLCFILSANLFAKALGGTSTEDVLSIIPTSDGGFAVAGYTWSFGAGNRDLLILKLSADGSLEWAKAFGGANDDRAHSITQTSDGGFAVAGVTNTFGAGDYDFLVLKLSQDGSLEWVKTIGGINSDSAFYITQTSDGGFAVAGATNTFGAGDYDLLVLKLSQDGSLQWAKTFGGGDEDCAYSIIQTSDGGFAVAGYTRSFGAGERDFLILKLSADGSLEWAKTFGGADWDMAFSITQTSDGGFAVAGRTSSFGAGWLDILIVKLSASGSLEWAKTFGGGDEDYAYSVIQTSDGGLAVAGWTKSFGAGSYDFLILKLLQNGSLEWAKTFGGGGNEWAHSIIQTSDGGFAVAGGTSSFGAGWLDFLVLILNPDGSYPGCVVDATPTEQGISLTTTSPSPSASSPNPTVTSPSVSFSDVSLSVEDACSPVDVCEFAASGLNYSPIPGGLLFSCDEPTEVRIYFPDGRLAESLLVDREARVYLKPGVYFIRWPGGRGALVVR